MRLDQAGHRDLNPSRAGSRWATALLIEATGRESRLPSETYFTQAILLRNVN